MKDFVYVPSVWYVQYQLQIQRRIFGNAIELNLYLKLIVSCDKSHPICFLLNFIVHLGFFLFLG